MSFRRSAASVLCAALVLSSWPAHAASGRSAGPALGPGAVPSVSIPAGLPALPGLPPGSALPEAAVGLPVSPAAPAPVEAPTAPAPLSPVAATPGRPAPPAPASPAAPGRPRVPAAGPEARPAAAVLTETASRVHEARAPQARASEALDRLYEGSPARAAGPSVPTLGASRAGSPRLAPPSRGPGGGPPSSAPPSSSGSAPSGRGRLLERLQALGVLLAGGMPFLALATSEAAQNVAVWGAGFGALASWIVARAALQERFEDRPSVLYAGLALAIVLAAGASGAAVAALAALSPAAAAGLVSAALLGLGHHTGRLAPLVEAFRRPAGAPPLFRVRQTLGSQYLEVGREQLGRLFLLSGTLAKGLGEKELHTTLSWDLSHLVYFRRSGDHLELVSKNTRFRARPGSPMQRTLDGSIPDSPIAKVRIAGEDRLTGRLSISLDELLGQDLFDVGRSLEASYGGRFALDEDTTSAGPARAFPKNLELEANLSYAQQERGAVPLDDEDGGPLEVATHLADLRRLPLTLRYSLSELPPSGFEPRRADERVGFFTVHYQDWSEEQKADLEAHLIQRWRLEKSDPYADSSPVKRPIVFWMDPSVPEEHRAAVARGALAWNKVFERIGLLGAIEVRDSSEAPDYDPDDIRFNAIRYYLERDSGYAFAKFRANPLTGEIYNGGVAISAKHARYPLGLNFKDFDELEDADFQKPRPARHCGYGEHRGRELAMNLALLESRGVSTAEERRRYIEDYMTDLVIHEVGHVLGLRHNFLAKSWRSLDEVETAHPFVASAMDYTPINIAPPGRKQGRFHNTEPGPYDHWAIEYGYRPLDGRTGAERRAELSRIASRSAEAGLAFATDEDLTDMDPRIQHWTLGGDVLAYARGRMETVRELWTLLEGREPADGEGYEAHYRTFVQGWLAYYKAIRQVVKHVGGIHHHRHHAGDPGGLLPYEPVPAQVQRAALQLLAEKVFADEPFRVSPELMRKLSPARLGTIKDPYPELSYLPLEELVLRLRREAALDFLLSESQLEVIAESRNLLPAGADHLTVGELFARLTKAVWAEALDGRRLKARSKTISPMRRQLQTAYSNRLMALAYLRADEEVSHASAEARVHLESLLKGLKKALRTRGWDRESRAYLKDMSAKLARAAEKYEP